MTILGLIEDVIETSRILYFRAAAPPPACPRWRHAPSCGSATPWPCPFWGTDRLLTRPKGAHTRPLTSHRLDPVGRHRDNPANGTKTQSHSTVGRPRHREWQGGRVGGVGLEGEDVVDKVLLIMLGSSPPRRSIRAGEGGGLGQRQGGGVPRHSSCCRWLPLRGAISVVLCGS